MPKFALSLVCTLTALLLCGPAAAKTQRITIAVPDPLNSYVYQIADEFAQRAQKYSQGTLSFNIVPDGTLYDGNTALGVKLLGSGSLQMMLQASCVYANLMHSFNLLSLPFLFDNREQLTAYLNSDLGQRLYNKLNRIGITVLARLPRSFRVITNAVRPIHKPDDLKGVKLRVPNNALFVEFFKRCGANALPMDFSEVFNALQLGTLDGQENPIDVPCDAKFYEVQKYVSLTNHMADAWIFGVNTDFLSSLDSTQQQAIQQASEDLYEWNLKKLDKEEQIKQETLEQHGMVVNQVSAAHQQQFAKIAQECYPSFQTLIEDDDLFEATLRFMEEFKAQQNR